MKYLLVICLVFMLCGTSQAKEIELPDNTIDINIHPYQIVGYYEEDEDGYTTRIFINRNWIEEINIDEQYFEILIKEPLQRP